MLSLWVRIWDGCFKTLSHSNFHLALTLPVGELRSGVQLPVVNCAAGLDR